MTRTNPPFVHVGLLGIVLILFLIGGQATLGSWGLVPVRPLAVFLLAAIVLHAASSYLPRGQLAARGSAWAVLASSTLFFAPLLRAPVVVPILALGALDAFIFRRGLALDEVPAGAKGRAIAGVATVAMLVLVGLLMVASRDALVLARLSGTVLAAWSIVAGLALRPAHRTPLTLLGGAGALSVVFFFLARPVLPYGPVLAYLVLVASMALAVLASLPARTHRALGQDHTLHEQTVTVLHDPALPSLAARVERFLVSGRGQETLSVRLEEALGEDEEGTLLERAVQARSATGESSMEQRAEALARLLQARRDTTRDGEA